MSKHLFKVNLIISSDEDWASRYAWDRLLDYSDSFDFEEIESEGEKTLIFTKRKSKD